MRLFGKVLLSIRHHRRFSLGASSRRRLFFNPHNLQQINTALINNVVSHRFFANKSGNSDDIVDGKFSSSSSGFQKPPNSDNTQPTKNLIPVALISSLKEKNAAVKVLLIPFHLFDSSEQAFRNSLSTLSILREHARQIEAFSENLNEIDNSTTTKLEQFSETTKNKPQIIDQQYNNNAIDESPETMWYRAVGANEQKHPNDDDLYKDIHQAVAEQEVNRIKTQDSFDVIEWNKSKDNLLATVPKTIEEKVKKMAISSVDLAFEMDITNIKDAILMNNSKNKSAETSTTPSAKEELPQTLKNPILSMTTRFDSEYPENDNKVPLNFNALIQGTIEIDSSKYKADDLADINVPEFNDSVTAIAANICSTALQKGFPADISRMSFSTHTGNTVNNRKSRLNTKNNQYKPHVICMRESSVRPTISATSGTVDKKPRSLSPVGVKLSPQTATIRSASSDATADTDKTNKSLKTTVAGAKSECTGVSRFGLMSCKAYAMAKTRAAQLRALTNPKTMPKSPEEPETTKVVLTSKPKLNENLMSAIEENEDIYEEEASAEPFVVKESEMAKDEKIEFTNLAATEQQEEAQDSEEQTAELTKAEETMEFTNLAAVEQQERQQELLEELKQELKHESQSEYQEESQELEQEPEQLAKVDEDFAAEFKEEKGQAETFETDINEINNEPMLEFSNDATAAEEISEKELVDNVRIDFSNDATAAEKLEPKNVEELIANATAEEKLEPEIHTNIDDLVETPIVKKKIEKLMICPLMLELVKKQNIPEQEFIPEKETIIDEQSTQMISLSNKPTADIAEVETTNQLNELEEIKQMEQLIATMEASASSAPTEAAGKTNETEDSAVFMISAEQHATETALDDHLSHPSSIILNKSQMDEMKALSLQVQEALNIHEILSDKMTTSDDILKQEEDKYFAQEEMIEKSIEIDETSLIFGSKQNDNTTTATTAKNESTDFMEKTTETQRTTEEPDLPKGTKLPKVSLVGSIPKPIQNLHPNPDSDGTGTKGDSKVHTISIEIPMITVDCECCPKNLRTHKASLVTIIPKGLPLIPEDMDPNEPVRTKTVTWIAAKHLEVPLIPEEDFVEEELKKKKRDPCKKIDPCKKKKVVKKDPCNPNIKEDDDWDPCAVPKPCKQPCKPPKSMEALASKGKDPCKKKKEDPCKKKDKKKEDPCKKKDKKKEKKKEDPCKKKEKKEDPCKKKTDKKKKKDDPCKKKTRVDPCKKKPKKEDPCKKKEKKKDDPCKKKDKKEKKDDPCKKIRKDKKEKKKEDPCKKKKDPCKKKEDPCKKKEKKKEDPCKKKKDKKKEKKKEDPCKKKEDPCKKKTKCNSPEEKKSTSVHCKTEDPCKNMKEKESKGPCGAGKQKPTKPNCDKKEAKKSDKCGEKKSSKKSGCAEKKDTKPNCGNKKKFSTLNYLSSFKAPYPTKRDYGTGMYALIIESRLCAMKTARNQFFRMLSSKSKSSGGGKCGENAPKVPKKRWDVKYKKNKQCFGDSSEECSTVKCKAIEETDCVKKVDHSDDCIPYKKKKGDRCNPDKKSKKKGKKGRK